MDLLNDNIKKVFFKYLGPSLGSAAIMSIYYLVDFIVVGRGVGAEGLAAFSIQTPLISIQFFFGVLIGIGGSVLYSNRKGMGKEDEGHEFFTVAVILISIAVVAIWVIFGFFHTPILKFLGASDVTMGYCWDYMRWYTIFAPATVTSSFWSSFVRNDEDPLRALVGTIIGGSLNMVLDFVFVFPLQMGMAGTALASVIGLSVNVLVVISHFFSKKNTLRLVKVRGFAKKASQICSGGISSSMVELSDTILIFLFNIMVLSVADEMALSVYGIICNWAILFFSMFNGIGLAIQPVASVNYGAGHMDCVKKFRNMGLVVAAIFAIFFTGSGYVLTRPLIALFLGKDASVFAISDHAIHIYFLAFLFMGFVLVLTFYYQSTLRLKAAFFTSLMHGLVFSAIYVLILPHFFGLSGVWAAYPAGEATALAFALCFLREKQGKQHPEMGKNRGKAIDG